MNTSRGRGNVDADLNSSILIYALEVPKFSKVLFRLFSPSCVLLLVSHQYLVFSACALSDSCESLTARESLEKASLSSLSATLSFSVRTDCSCNTWCSFVTNSRYLFCPRFVLSNSSYKDFRVCKREPTSALVFCFQKCCIHFFFRAVYIFRI